MLIKRLKFIKYFTDDPLLLHTVTSLFISAVFALFVLVVNPFNNSKPQIAMITFGPAVSFAIASYISFKIVKETKKRHLDKTNKIFAITKETVSHLRHGLAAESASAVAKILARLTDAAVVAITDTNTVLACEGDLDIGYVACGPIITEKTKEAIASGSVKIISGSDEIGCPSKSCFLKSGIIVPLHLKNAVCGTLKFYYKDDKGISNEKVAFAKGIANLLSTQLELSEIEYQTTLAFKSQLKALQTQINPHFLFNTLNTIAMFCRTKPTEARRLLLEFSAFFRKSLERTDDLITLKDELEYVNQYMIFEKARFGNGIEFNTTIDPATIDVKMPALTLQPIVENSIRHGFPIESKPLHVNINSKLEHDTVYITITDNGSGIKKMDIDKIFVPGFGRGLGLGLSNMNERLRGLFKNKYKISVASRPNRGTSVIIQLPANGDKIDAA
jgi:LytS/YehU family sensor histidine kinase